MNISDKIQAAAEKEYPSKFRSMDVSRNCFKQGANFAIKELGLYSEDDLIKFAQWFNENQWRGVPGDYTKSRFIKCDYPAIVEAYLNPKERKQSVKATNNKEGWE